MAVLMSARRNFIKGGQQNKTKTKTMVKKRPFKKPKMSKTGTSIETPEGGGKCPPSRLHPPTGRPWLYNVKRVVLTLILYILISGKRWRAECYRIGANRSLVGFGDVSRNIYSRVYIGETSYDVCCDFVVLYADNL